MRAAQARSRQTVSRRGLGAASRFAAVRSDAASLDDVMRAIAGLIAKASADPAVIKLARQIVSGKYDDYQGQPVIMAWGRPYHAPQGGICQTRDDACEIEAIWDFVVLNVRYTLDPTNVDTYTDPRYTLEAGAGDCDDMTILFCSLLEAIGFQMAARVISVNGGSWEHIYPLVGVPKGNPTQWFPLDATEPDRAAGWEYPNPAAIQDYRL